MPVIISMLRGVNLAAHNRIRMDALRALYTSLELEDPRTYVQSGNVLFRTRERSLPRLAARIGDAIETTFGFRPEIILRTTAELRDAVARNPFAGRPNLDGSRLLVTFLAAHPTPEAQARLLALDTAPEEHQISGRELYVYYPNGMARPKIPWTTLEKTLKVPGTGRNWNSVNAMLKMAEELESQ